jgi:CRISPR system Cascade subunit CasA
MSVAEQPTFDLVEQPWLPARTLDGDSIELSLVDLLARSHDLATLSGDLATQTFALTRLLLAVLHGALDGPRDLDHWEQLWWADTLPLDEVAAYLDRYRGRFDLFHPDTPFFQVAGLHTAKGDMSELSKLIADVPNGKPYFTTRLGPELSLSYAEAARWVVHCQAFDPSGIKSGAVGDTRVKGGKGYPIGTGWSGRLGCVVPEGATLRETLLLNLIPSDFGTARSRDNDKPVWEREALDATVQPGRVPTGPVDLYTWQSRRIRLLADRGRVTQVLICNGDPITPQNRHTVEPHTRWRRSRAQEKKLGHPVVYMPREHIPERAIWRGLQSLLPGGKDRQGTDAAPGVPADVLEWLSELTIEVLGGDFPIRVRTVGMNYGSQSSVTDDVIDDAMSLRSELMRRDAPDLVGVAVSCVDAADRAARALGDLALDLAHAGGKVPPARAGLPDPSDVADRTRAVELAFAELDVPFRTWLTGLGPASDPTAAQIAWHQIARFVVGDLARDLQRRASAVAWTGRWINGRMLTAAHAADRFDRKLREALPQAYQETTTTEPSPA